jgi:hypothetical protein
MDGTTQTQDTFRDYGDLIPADRIFNKEQNMDNSMTLQGKLELLHVDIENDSATEIAEACKLIVQAESLTGGARSTLRACYSVGPLNDGDVPSKSGRDDLLSLDFAAKIIVKGLEGYNACTQKGYWAAKILGITETN